MNQSILRSLSQCESHERFVIHGVLLDNNDAYIVHEASELEIVKFLNVSCLVYDLRNSWGYLEYALESIDSGTLKYRASAEPSGQGLTICCSGVAQAEIEYEELLAATRTASKINSADRLERPCYECRWPNFPDISKPTNMSLKNLPAAVRTISEDSGLYRFDYCQRKLIVSLIDSAANPCRIWFSGTSYIYICGFGAIYPIHRVFKHGKEQHVLQVFDQESTKVFELFFEDAGLDYYR